jgi:2-methylcitrate dehydratase
MKKDQADLRSTALDRRELMRLSAGVGAGFVMGQALTGSAASAQERATPSTAAQSAAYRPDAWENEVRYSGVKMESGPGWKHDSNRASGNGTMDETSRRIVQHVHSFSAADLTGTLENAFANTMIDTIASLVSGFESEPARICARLARANQSELKSTVLGYGIVTTPELAAYANSSMIRHTDFNDHYSDMIGAILAVGEAAHASGTEVMLATILAYQVYQALSRAGGNTSGFDSGIYYGPAAAVAAGKLLGLSEDQLANALSLAVTMYIPLRVCRSGTLSMQKGCSTADAARTAVFAALAAREGMTAPAEPFEGRDGLWDKITGPYRQLEFRSPDPADIALNSIIKRYPAEAYTLAAHQTIIPEIRAWTSIDDIAAIHVELNFVGWLEIADPPKWDPKNRETADHSLPYEIARALIDGEIWIDSFEPEKLAEPAVRTLMDKITASVNPDYRYHGQMRITVRTKSGAELVREIGNGNTGISLGTAVTQDEIVAKFNRVFAFMNVSDRQRERALAQWSNLRAVDDIAEPIRNLAEFGRPAPL